MPRKLIPLEFLNYLASISQVESSDQLPSLVEISKTLEISVASLREQVEVAKALGLVEVRPHTGIRRKPYSFFPAVQQSLGFALKLSPENFAMFADLRNRLEASYWHAAVRRLENEDKNALHALMASAWEKLNGSPVQIPHDEHRKLHLTIYRRLNNPFVTGILEAYWDAYEAVGLSVYTDFDYLQQVWKFHQQIVDAICQGNLDAGYQALVAHTELLLHRSEATPVSGGRLVG